MANRRSSLQAIGFEPADQTRKGEAAWQAAWARVLCGLLLPLLIFSGCDEPAAFEMKELTSEASHDTVTADEEGRVWLLFGTRSGFEGKTSLFYTRFRAELLR